MDDVFRVMTVCTGNICRSPMAEVVLRDRFEAAGLGERVVVDSTGISAEEHGNPIDPRARAVLAARGYPVPVREAREVRAIDLVASDLVLAMTEVHAHALRRLAGADDVVAGRVVMFRAFDPAAPRIAPGGREYVLDVDDPWYGGPDDFEDCLTQVEAAADGVVARVRLALAEHDSGT
ncbi:low molecular weight phosphotyrosine protein phosphatase [Pengzhenrongella frigida]|uniref:protein-tyrosine-phosphatase n=2 Tax=Pengzhenrongella frigida TaxID=1259133 RepID=A0A4Q5N1E3_9MICO|nr:low molecular weight phosphotyrosine protein phosphatase [Cellulomonas sp. HLT2-17]